MTTQERAVVQAVERAKVGEHHTTSFKFEFEAFFGRRRGSESCDYCGEGYQECGCCEGSGNHYCDECNGEGNYRCGTCDGEGAVEHEDDEGDMLTEDCEDCDGDGYITCNECSGEGRYDCDDCDGDGQVECSVCDGDWRGDVDNPFVDEIYCHDWVLEYLSRYGLAEPSGEEGYRPVPAGYPAELLGDVRPIARHWKPKGAMAFSKVYYDSTVDTEWTVTLSVESKASAILHARHLVEAFNALGKAIQEVTGTETNIENAGMHISALNSEGAVYPSSGRGGDSVRYANFRKSMTLMMPALYFLASSCENTRGLEYRAPQISTSKYSAIHYEGGALEFRVFDTCYQHPEQILDNVFVICNALEYWRTNYKRHYLDRVTNGKTVYFGVDRGYSDLKHMFVTSQHLDLLNRGLKLLKPSYYTITDLKKQRGFTVTKRNTKNLDNEWKIRAENEYKEYERRIGWETVMVQHNFIRRYVEEHMYSNEHPEVSTELVTELEAKAKAEAELEVQARKLPLDKFVEQKIDEYSQREVGKYKLAI